MRIQHWRRSGSGVRRQTCCKRRSAAGSRAGRRQFDEGDEAHEEQRQRSNRSVEQGQPQLRIAARRPRADSSGIVSSTVKTATCKTGGLAGQHQQDQAPAEFRQGDCSEIQRRSVRPGGHREFRRLSTVNLPAIRQGLSRKATTTAIKPPRVSR